MVTEPLTTFKDLDKAYKDKVEMVYFPERYLKAKLTKERKAKGVCIYCGHKKITKYQKEHNIISCIRCRIKERLKKDGN